MYNGVASPNASFFTYCTNSPGLIFLDARHQGAFSNCLTFCTRASNVHPWIIPPAPSELILAGVWDHFDHESDLALLPISRHGVTTLRMLSTTLSSLSLPSQPLYPSLTRTCREPSGLPPSSLLRAAACRCRIRCCCCCCCSWSRRR